MDKKILAHLSQLSRSELTARATKMGDIIDDLEELADALDDLDIEIVERAIQEIRELRLRVMSLESRMR
jgi:Asp-tRNA(Asn)/Glu-tRNA(Gln) amidotransferase C subunit